MKKILIPAFLAVAALGASAQAQVATSYGDLILGFRASGGTGQNSNLEVDIGSITTYKGVGAGKTITVAQLSAADIASTYGANWATRTDLVWGVVGTDSRTATGPDSEPAGTLWATNAETTAGTQSTAFRTGSFAALAPAAALMEPLYANEPGSLGGKTGTTNSPTHAAIINATAQGSYSVQDTYQAGASFEYFVPSVDNSTNIGAGNNAASDLYELRPGASAATYIGTFGLNSSGVLTFSTTPSSFAQGAGNETFTTQPANATIVSGTTVVFNAAATGSPVPSYKWYLNGVALSDGGSVAGSGTARLVITGAVGANAGVYTVVASNTSGSVTSNTASLTIGGTASNPGRLVNLSMINNITSNLSMGFVIGGNGTSGSESLLIRAIGPTLGSAFNYPGVMPDPTLTVVQQSNHTTLTTDAGWGTPASNVALVQTADAATGAFALTNTASADSAVVQTLPISTGGYSVVVASKTGVSGNALTEVYDDTTTYALTSPRLVNLSSSTSVAAGGSLSIGFVLGGTTAKTVLIRASGPTLAATFGETGTMPDPQLTVTPTSSSSTVLAANAGWAGDPALTSAFNAVGAFAFASATSKDSAVLVTLQPGGNYTVTASSVSGAGGTVLIEVYEVP